MATYYVDFAAGSGNGGTTSTPAKDFPAITAGTPGAGDTVKIKGSPNPTLLGTASAKMGWGHAMWYSATNGFSNFTCSTTAGESTCTINSSTGGGSMVGETVEVEGNTYDKGNLNGTWKIGAMVGSMSGESATYKIEEFQATSAGTPSGSSGSWWPSTGKVLYLNSTPIKALASTGPRTSGWTAAANVTCTLEHNNNPEWSSTHKNFEHCCSDKIEIGADHGTGLAAYFQITALSDSQYEQISFQMAQHSGTYTNGLSLRLCTGSDGTGSVKSIPIDFSGNSSSWRWKPFVKDFGEALTSGGNINSVAIYVDTDEGARNFNISNIIACKASDQNDSITHKSLVGFNTTDDPYWRSPKSIRDLPDGKTRIEFFCAPLNAEPHGYQGSGRVVGFAADYTNANIYKRECIQVQDSTLDAGTDTNLHIDFNGSSGNPVTVSGGWNSDYSSQNLNHSILDYKRHKNRFYISGNYLHVEKLGVCRAHNTVQFNGTQYKVDDFIIDSQSSGFYAQGTCEKLNIVGHFYGSNTWFQSSGWRAVDSSGNNATSAHKANFNVHISGGGASSQAIYLSNSSSNYVFNKLAVRGSMYNGNLINFYNGAPFYADTLEISSATQPTHYSSTQFTLNIDNIVLKNCSYPFRVIGKSTLNAQTYTYSQDDAGYKYAWNNQALDIKDGSTATITNGPTIVDKKIKITDGKLFTNNDSITGDFSSSPIEIESGSWHKRTAGGVSGAIENFYGNGLIYPNQSIRKTASGYSWKFATQNFSNATTGSPIAIELGSIAVNASSQVTISVWCYRTNTSAIGRLKAKLNTLIGLSSDVTAITSGSVNTWEQISLNFTPTSSGYVDISLEAYDGPGYYVYFDDVAAAQA